MLQAQPFIDLSAESICWRRARPARPGVPERLRAVGPLLRVLHQRGRRATPAGASIVARFLRSAANPLLADKSTRFDLLWPAMPDIHSTCTSVQSDRAALRLPALQRITTAARSRSAPTATSMSAFGDGGSGGDPEHQAQKPRTVLGKIVRLDVSVPMTDHARLSHSRRQSVRRSGQPWPRSTRSGRSACATRGGFTFDQPVHGGTGALTIGDVGQGAWEEIDYEPARSGGTQLRLATARRRERLQRRASRRRFTAAHRADLRIRRCDRRQRQHVDHRRLRLSRHGARRLLSGPLLLRRLHLGPRLLAGARRSTPVGQRDRVRQSASTPARSTRPTTTSARSTPTSTARSIS